MTISPIHPAPPSPVLTRSIVEAALFEDLASAGDVTSQAIVPPGVQATARVVAREPGRVAGLFLVDRVFEALDPGLSCEAKVAEGGSVEKGQTLAFLSGAALPLLTGERTALNFLGRLSGIATLTARYREAMGDSSAELASTRKTTPGLRALEKWAVVAGGGGSHRYGLYDAVLVKDNHLIIAGGLEEAVKRLRERCGPLAMIQVEADRLDQLEKLLTLPVDAVLLDNMSLEELRRAVSLASGELFLEASGGITLDNVGAVADTGVDRVSVGALTKSAPALDVALDFELS